MNILSFYRIGKKLIEQQNIGNFENNLTHKMLILSKKETVETLLFQRFLMVEVTGIEPATSWSQTTRATNCATPRYI